MHRFITREFNTGPSISHGSMPLDSSFPTSRCLSIHDTAVGYRYPGVTRMAAHYNFKLLFLYHHKADSDAGVLRNCNTRQNQLART